VSSLRHREKGITELMNRLRKALACATTAASLVGLCAAPSQAAPEMKVGAGHWSNRCDAGHACVEISGHRPATYWVFDGCYFHTIYTLALSGVAHGNAFRVTYQNDHWDDVEAWTNRPLDNHTETKYVYVYC
jgi:hypothetical protein